MTKRTLGMNCWQVLLSIVQIIAPILCLPLKLMKSWLRPAHLWKGLGLVLGVCFTDENHRNLTEHTDTVFQVHEKEAVLAYGG